MPHVRFEGWDSGGQVPAPLTASIRPIKPMAATAGSYQGVPARPLPLSASSHHRRQKLLILSIGGEAANFFMTGFLSYRHSKGQRQTSRRLEPVKRRFPADGPGGDAFGSN